MATMTNDTTAKKTDTSITMLLEGGVKKKSFSYQQRKICVNIKVLISKNTSSSKSYPSEPTQGTNVTEFNVELSTNKYVEDLTNGIAKFFNITTSTNLHLYRCDSSDLSTRCGLEMRGFLQLADYVLDSESSLAIKCYWDGNYMGLETEIKGKIYVPIDVSRVWNMKDCLAVLTDLKPGQFELLSGSVALSNNQLCHSLGENPVVQIVSRLPTD